MESPSRRSKRKWFWIAAGAPVAICAAGWIGLNLFLNSESVKKRLSSQVEAIAGAPLEIGKISASPWGGIRLREMRMELPPEDAAQPALPPFFFGSEMRVKLDWWSVPRKHIRIREIAIEDPAITVARATDGRLLLPKLFSLREMPVAPPAITEGALEESVPVALAPGMPPGQTGPAAGAGAVQPAGPVAGTPPGPGKTDSAAGSLVAAGGTVAAGAGAGVAAGDGAAVTKGGTGAAGKPEEGAPRSEKSALVVRYGDRMIHLGDVILRGGTLRVVSLEGDGGAEGGAVGGVGEGEGEGEGAEGGVGVGVGEGVGVGGRTLLEVQGMEWRFDLEGDPPDAGKFSASRAVLFDRVELTDLKSDIGTRSMVFHFTDFTAECAGGTIEAEIQVSPLNPALPFRATARGKDISLEEFVARSGLNLEFSAGKIFSAIRAEGYLRAPSTYRAAGRCQVEGASLHGSGLLVSGAGATAREHLEEMPFDEMGFTFAANKGQIMVDELRVASPEITLTGRGFIDFAGALSMASRFYITERVYYAVQALEARLPAQFAFGFQQHATSGRYYRDYLVRNSVADPTFNLWQAAPGDVRVRDLRTIFSRMIQMAARSPGAGGESGPGTPAQEAGTANE